MNGAVPPLAARGRWCVSPRFLVLLSPLVFALALSGNCLSQTELGSEDDLTVMGTDGDAVDPDVEIKGFSVFGSTQTSYAGAVVGPGNVVVNGVLAVSSGAYFVGNSTFTAAGNIFINDGAAGQLLRRHSAGHLEWSDSSALGDNLGSHIATTTLQMGAYGVNTSSNITAARYQIAGSTVLAVLPGTGSMGVGINAGKANNAGGLYNIFVGYNAGQANTTGDYNSFVGYQAGYSNTGGSNSFMGSGAGYTNAGGNSNSFFGESAGYYNEAGSYNVFMGYQSGHENTNGAFNTFVGAQAGSNNTTAAQNSFIGSYSGTSNETGANNSYVGYYAGYENVTGSANSILGTEAAGGSLSGSFSSSTLMGYQAGYAITTGSDNLLLGFRSGDSLTTGSRNIIIGYDKDAPTATTNDYINIGGLLHGDMAQSTMTVYGDFYADKFYGDGSGLSGITGSGDNLGNHVATTTLQMGAYGVNTSSHISAAAYQINGATMAAILAGSNSIAYGVYAGTSNKTGGDYNTFIGNYAGQANTTGSDNTATGYDALYSNTYGSNNTAYGFMALYSNISGTNNTANGYMALYSNTTGEYNTANGLSALNDNTTGSNNTANGVEALSNNTSGVANTATGIYALYANTTGSDNNAIGADALSSNTSGSNNTVNGSSAVLYSKTGSQNTVSGYKAGRGASNQSFSSSTIIGAGAGYSLTTGSNNTFLGWQAGYNVTSGTGNIVIGYDQRTPAPDTNNLLNIGGLLYGDLSARTIGISTRAPQAALDIVSTGTLVSQFAQIWRDGGGVIKGSMSATGVLQAVKFVGDGSALTGITGTGDNLGNHTATQDLNLAGNSVLNVDSMSVVGQAGYGGSILTISTGTSTMVEIKGTGEILAKKITVQSGVAAKISTDEGDIAIEPAGGDVNVAGNINVAGGFIYYGDGSGLTNLSGVSPVGSALTSANIWVGNASNVAAAVAMSGEGSLANTGAFTLSKAITPTWTGAHIFNGAVTANNTFTLGDGVDAGSVNTSTWDISTAGAVSGVTTLNMSGVLTNSNATTSALTMSGATSGINFSGTGVINTSDWAISATGGLTGISGITNDGAYTQSGTSANTFTGAVTASNAAGVTTPKVKLVAGVELSSTTAANYGGVYSSSHVYVNGDVHALKYYGNGSGLSGVAGDNLGNHTATQDLNLAGNSVLNVDSMSVVGQAGYGGAIVTISTGTSTMVEIKGTGEILAKQITVQSGVAAKISTDVGDIAIEPAGGNVNVAGNLNVANGSNVGLEGASGDTYMKFNPGYISMYVNGLEVARFKP